MFALPICRQVTCPGNRENFHYPFIHKTRKLKKKRELIAFDNSEFFIYEQNRLFEYLVDVP